METTKQHTQQQAIKRIRLPIKANGPAKATFKIRRVEYSPGRWVNEPKAGRHRLLPPLDVPTIKKDEIDFANVKLDNVLE